MQKNKIILTFLFLTLLTNKLSACCGCAIVNSAMAELRAATSESLQEIEMTTAQRFKEKVLRQNERYLSELQTVKTDIDNGTKINKEMFKAYDNITFTIKKQNSIQAVKGNK